MVTDTTNRIFKSNKEQTVLETSHIYFIDNSYGFTHDVSTYDTKLNLQEPKTIEELHDVLVAFAEKDPNGNGKKDEVPIFNRGDTVAKVLQPLTDMFKARAVWYDDKDVVKFGPAQAEYKEAIRQLAKWYKEGAKKGESNSQYRIGRILQLSGEIKEAFKYYNKSAKQKNIYGIIRVIEYYYVNKNYKEEKKWIYKVFNENNILELNKKRKFILLNRLKEIEENN